MEPNVKHLIVAFVPWSTSPCILRTFPRVPHLGRSGPSKTAGRGNTLPWFLVWSQNVYSVDLNTKELR